MSELGSLSEERGEVFGRARMVGRKAVRRRVRCILVILGDGENRD